MDVGGDRVVRAVHDGRSQRHRGRCVALAFPWSLPFGCEDAIRRTVDALAPSDRAGGCSVRVHLDFQRPDVDESIGRLQQHA